MKLEMPMKKQIIGILEAIRSRINSAVVEGLNNKIKKAFKRSYSFKPHEYGDTITYSVAG